MNQRFVIAMVCYAVLIGASFTLLHGKPLYAVLVLLVGLALKTVVALKAHR